MQIREEIPGNKSARVGKNSLALVAALFFISGSAFGEQDCIQKLAVAKKPNWCYEAETDKETGETVKSTIIASNNMIGYSAKQRGILKLQRKPDGYVAMFRVLSGSIDARVCLLGVRLDQKPPGIVRCEMVSDYAVVADAGAFVAKIKSARHLLIEVSLNEDGTHIFEFEVTDLANNF